MNLRIAKKGGGRKYLFLDVLIIVYSDNLFVNNKQVPVVRERIYTASTILYIDKLLLDRQHIVYIGWDNSILGQPVKT